MPGRRGIRSPVEEWAPLWPRRSLSCRFRIFAPRGRAPRSFDDCGRHSSTNRQTILDARLAAAAQPGHTGQSNRSAHASKGRDTPKLITDVAFRLLFLQEALILHTAADPCACDAVICVVRQFASSPVRQFVRLAGRLPRLIPLRRTGSAAPRAPVPLLGAGCAAGRWFRCREQRRTPVGAGRS